MSMCHDAKGAKIISKRKFFLSFKIKYFILDLLLQLPAVGHLTKNIFIIN